MPNTHCLPSGSLGTAELPVPAVNAGTMTTVAASGTRKGVAVLMHGLQTTIVATPMPVPNLGGIFPVKFGDLAAALTADGWECLYITYAEDFAAGNPSLAVQSDIVADAAHGARYLAQALRWWDHVVAYIKATYGASTPIVPAGLSWGGWHSLVIAANRETTIKAYCSHVAPIILSQASPVFTNPADFSAVNTTGFDFATTGLNAVRVPGLVGWADSDTAAPPANIQAVVTAGQGAGSPITTNDVTGGHALSSAAVTNIASWWTSVVDPLV